MGDSKIKGYILLAYEPCANLYNYLVYMLQLGILGFMVRLNDCADLWGFCTQLHDPQ